MSEFGEDDEAPCQCGDNLAEIENNSREMLLRISSDSSLDDKLLRSPGVPTDWTEICVSWRNVQPSPTMYLNSNESNAGPVKTSNGFLERQTNFMPKKETKIPKNPRLSHISQKDFLKFKSNVDTVQFQLLKSIFDVETFTYIDRNWVYRRFKDDCKNEYAGKQINSIKNVAERIPLPMERKSLYNEIEHDLLHEISYKTDSMWENFSSNLRDTLDESETIVSKENTEHLKSSSMNERLIDKFLDTIDETLLDQDCSPSESDPNNTAFGVSELEGARCLSELPFSSSLMDASSLNSLLPAIPLRLYPSSADAKSSRGKTPPNSLLHKIYDLARKKRSVERKEVPCAKESIALTREPFTVRSIHHPRRLPHLYRDHSILADANQQNQSPAITNKIAKLRTKIGGFVKQPLGSQSQNTGFHGINVIPNVVNISGYQEYVEILGRSGIARDQISGGVSRNHDEQPQIFPMQGVTLKSRHYRVPADVFKSSLNCKGNNSGTDRKMDVTQKECIQTTEPIDTAVAEGFGLNVISLKDQVNERRRSKAMNKCTFQLTDADDRIGLSTLHVN